MTEGETLEINTFDFQAYLRGLYVEQEVLDRLLDGQKVEKMHVEEINRLPYLNFPFGDGFFYEQREVWPKLLSIYL